MCRSSADKQNIALQIWFSPPFGFVWKKWYGGFLKCFFPNNSCYCRIFHEINHLFGGSPIYGTPRIPESLGWSFFPVQIAIKCAGNSRGHRGHPLLGRPKKTRSGADKDTVHWCLWFKVAFYTYMYIYEYIYIYVYKPTLCKLYIYIYTHIYI